MINADPNTDQGDTCVRALLPWYINGTLSREECDTVEANLLRSSSLPRKLQVWQCVAQSLQAEPDNTAAEQDVLERLQTNFGTDLQSEPRHRSRWLFAIRCFRIARIVISVLAAIGLGTLLIWLLLAAAVPP